MQDISPPSGLDDETIYLHNACILPRKLIDLELPKCVFYPWPPEGLKEVIITKRRYQIRADSSGVRRCSRLLTPPSRSPTITNRTSLALFHPKVSRFLQQGSFQRNCCLYTARPRLPDISSTAESVSYLIFPVIHHYNPLLLELL